MIVYLSRSGIYGLTVGINVERLYYAVVNPCALYTGACDIYVFVDIALVYLSVIAGDSRVHVAGARHDLAPAEDAVHQIIELEVNCSQDLPYARSVITNAGRTVKTYGGHFVELNVI
jgi:hypothetical protein